jgi:hypothetical protein
MNRRTRIVFPVFNGYEVRVVQAHSVQATGKSLHVDLSDAQAALVTDPAHPSVSWLVLGPKADEADVAHEASHAIRAMFKTMGVQHAANEVFAYHLDYLVGRIHKFLKRKR